MEQGYLIDNCLHNRLPTKANDIIDSNRINMSVITRMELLAWKKATTDQLRLLHNFIDASNVYSLDETTILEGIEIRKNHNIKLPDAIIAATALVNNYILVTRNTVDFKGIPKLILVDPSR